MCLSQVRCFELLGEIQIFSLDTSSPRVIYSKGDCSGAGEILILLRSCSTDFKHVGKDLVALPRRNATAPFSKNCIVWPGPAKFPRTENTKTLDSSFGPAVFLDYRSMCADLRWENGRVSSPVHQWGLHAGLDSTHRCRALRSAIC